MKKLLTIILILVCSHVFAQDSLKTFNNARINTTSSGMEVLGGWGALNLATGAIAWPNSTSPEARYFFKMNTIWGAVNFGTGLLTYAGLQKQRKKHFTAAETLKEQQRIEKIFRINSYLDVAYIGAGLYLRIAGDSRHSPIMKGYGESVILQGGFLLLFDQLMLKAEKGNGTKLRTFLEKHPISFDGHRIGMAFNM
jgi:hypothetical protein